MIESKEKKEVEIELSKSGNTLGIRLLSGFTISNAKLIDAEFRFDQITDDIKKISVDLSDPGIHDSYIVTYLIELEEYCKSRNIGFEFVSSNTETLNFVKLLKPKLREDIAKREPGFFEYVEGVGQKTKDFLSEIYDFTDFLGQTTRSIFKTFIKPGNFRAKDFPRYFINSGPAALPVNILIVLLLGFIIGWQGALLLRQFGGSAYLAPLVGFSIVRELSPLMVAIVVAGRSGAAFTAEIGTMKVSEELDALETMGFDKYGFLVLPRVVSLMISVPLLIMICNVVGVLGGLLAGLSTLNITMVSYFTELTATMTVGDVTYGLIKGVVFGFSIALIGCFSGMKVTGSAESVGRRTTASVVISIFMVIVIDAVFVVLYDAIY